MAPSATPSRRRPVRIARRLRARSRLGFREADRVTQGLAALTAVTAGAVLAGEFARRFRRRAARADVHVVGEAPIEALHVAGDATRDTVRVAIEGYESGSRQELVLFNLLTGFAGAFVLARLSTTGVRAGWWPFHDLQLGDRHIHHFVPGILIAFGAATGALLSDDRDRHAAMALPFGVGVGLTFDEAALLLDLRDVYWTREGLLSVQLSLGGVVLLSGTILALRILRRGERRVTEAGLIPDQEGELLAPSPVAAPGSGVAAQFDPRTA
jgi:hypothetical protein